jgi:hypothetical protein
LEFEPEGLDPAAYASELTPLRATSDPRFVLGFAELVFPEFVFVEFVFAEFV